MATRTRQVCNLTDIEKSLYEQYGPDYANHHSLDPQTRKRLGHYIERRARTAQKIESIYGKDWYEIIMEAEERLVAEEAASGGTLRHPLRTPRQRQFQREAAEARGVVLDLPSERP